MIKTVRQKIQKAYRKQVKTIPIHILREPTVLLFVLVAPDQTDKVQIQTKTKITEIQIITLVDKTIKTVDTKRVAIYKTTDTTTTAKHQTSNKNETTQDNNRVEIVREQTINREVVRLVLTPVVWDICPANTEYQYRIRTIDKKIRKLNKAIRTRDNKIKTATQIPHSKKVF